jgi:excisionase family DNA binding protein
MTTSAEVVAAVRELSGPRVKQVEIAAKAGCSKSQVSVATSLLTHAPDLAQAVAAGRLGLSRASVMARQRPPASSASSLPDDVGWLPPVFLTVTEAAAKLSRHRTTVMRLLHAGELRSVRLGRSYRIPEAEVHRIAAGQPFATTAPNPGPWTALAPSANRSNAARACTSSRESAQRPPPAKPRTSVP